MCEKERERLLREYADEYNDERYFQTDPIIFPKHYTKQLKKNESTLQDVEIAAIISAHLAWGRRDMIVKNLNKAMDEMCWQPYQYIINGEYRNDHISLHRTIKWSDFAQICQNLKKYYAHNHSLEALNQEQIRTQIYGQKSDLKAANKKINMLRRWMVRDDGKVDLGIWKNIDKRDLIIPLDVHVHRTALEFKITERRSTDLKTALEITHFLKTIFPDDPMIGDFALFRGTNTK